MSHPFAEITFTPAVKALQEKYGSRAQYARMQARGGLAPMLGPRESEFLAGADSFYLATVGETGWPYVQHRGGPAGFLKVRSEAQLAFADFRGNLQYVSAGNVAHDDRASLFVMDYVNRARSYFGTGTPAGPGCRGRGQAARRRIIRAFDSDPGEARRGTGRASGDHRGADAEPTGANTWAVDASRSRVSAFSASLSIASRRV